jgi:hypothetical protein
MISDFRFLPPPKKIYTGKPARFSIPPPKTGAGKYPSFSIKSYFINIKS